MNMCFQQPFPLVNKMDMHSNKRQCLFCACLLQGGAGKESGFETGRGAFCGKSQAKEECQGEVIMTCKQFCLHGTYTLLATRYDTSHDLLGVLLEGYPPS